MAREGTQPIERELDRVRSLGLEELRSEWRRLYHNEPPKISRDLLVLALGYRSPVELKMHNRLINGPDH
jgi:hypothetical protein